MTMPAVSSADARARRRSDEETRSEILELAPELAVRSQ